MNDSIVISIWLCVFLGMVTFVFGNWLESQRQEHLGLCDDGEKHRWRLYTWRLGSGTKMRVYRCDVCKKLDMEGPANV